MLNTDHNKHSKYKSSSTKVNYNCKYAIFLLPTKYIHEMVNILILDIIPKIGYCSYIFKLKHHEVICHQLNLHIHKSNPRSYYMPRGNL